MPQLPSALENLTTVFGMGTGVTSLQSLPDKHFFLKFHPCMKGKIHGSKILYNTYFSSKEF